MVVASGTRWFVKSWSGLGVALVLAGTLAATLSGAASAQDPVEVNQELLQLVVELLNDTDKDMRAVGLEQVRTELKGEVATRQLLELLPQLNTSAKQSLVGALGERGDVSAQPALLKIVRDPEGDLGLRGAAIQAAAALGNQADVEWLVGLLAGPSPELREAAAASLKKLAGSETSQVLSEFFERQPPAVQLILMEVMVARRAAEGVPGMLQAAKGADSQLRAAAITALGQLASTEHLPGLLATVLRAEPGKEREAAEKAVMFVCQRAGEADERCLPLLAAVEALPEADQLLLLSTLGRVGGQKSRERIEGMIASSEPGERELGIRALCNWPDASVAERLLALRASEPRKDLQASILGALIRIAPLPDDRTSEERLGLLKEVMELCSQDSDKKLVLRRAPAIRTIETLRFVVPYLDQPALAAQAQEAVVELAHHRNLREPNKEEFARVLDRVEAETKDEVVRDRAQRYKKGQTWDRKSVGR